MNGEVISTSTFIIYYSIPTLVSEQVQYSYKAQALSPFL
jgi:hypothetical protein